MAHCLGWQKISQADAMSCYSRPFAAMVEMAIRYFANLLEIAVDEGWKHCCISGCSA